MPPGEYKPTEMVIERDELDEKLGEDPPSDDCLHDNNEERYLSPRPGIEPCTVEPREPSALASC